MQMGYEQLKKADAAVKHMIVLTDGMTPEAEFAALCRQMRQDKITVSAVAVGSDADRALLARIASMGKGKFYAAPGSGPRRAAGYRQVETRRIATPVIRELNLAQIPLRIADHQMLTGIEGDFPALGGFVQTTVKENSLVEVLLRSPVPALEKNATVLATWTYGLGETAALTTDAGSLSAALMEGLGRAIRSSSHNWFAGRCGPAASRATIRLPPRPMAVERRLWSTPSTTKMNSSTSSACSAVS